MSIGVSREEAALELLARAEARRDLLAFTEYTHGTWVSAWYHRLICKYLHKLYNAEIERLVINTAPRHGKSELASKRFPAWVLGQRPDFQIISTSAGESLSDVIGADVRDIVNDQKYQNLFPQTEMRADARAAGKWRTTKDGIYIAGSVGSQIVGHGANLAIIDDPHKSPEEADSQHIRDKIDHWYHGAFITRLMPPFLQLLIMTRWHEDDLTGRLLPPESQWELHEEDQPWVWRVGEWTVVKLPAIFKDTNDQEHGLGHVYYPLKRLQARRKELLDGGHARDWYSQYMQSPSVEEGLFIKADWFKERYTEYIGPEEAAEKGLRIYIAADFAVTDQTQAKDPDRTEIGVFGYGPDKRIYVLHWETMMATSDVWITRLVNLFKEWKPLTFFGEVGQIRRSVEPFLNAAMVEHNAYCALEWMPTGSDKIARGQAFQARASVGRIVLPKGMQWAEDFIDEVTKVPSGRYWDKFDTMSHLCLAIDKLYASGVSEDLPPPEEPDYEDELEDMVAQGESWKWM